MSAIKMNKFKEFLLCVFGFKKKRVYILDDGETHWLVATSEKEALEVGLNEYCIGEGNEVISDVMGDEELLVVPFDSVSDVPYPLSYVDGKVEATAKEWCDSSAVGAFLGSTIY